MLTSDVSSDDGEFQPLSICNGELLKHLIACVESDIKEVPLLDQEVAREMEETAVIERDQEKEVLEDGFWNDCQRPSHRKKLFCVYAALF